MTESSFPGRWLGGITMVLGPLVLLTGVGVRAGQHFFFPDQLAFYERQPTRTAIAYGAFVAGNVLLWPAVVTLAQRIGVTHPRWALWGGALTTSGLFARAFQAGVDHMAFRLVDVQGADAATRVVADTYGTYYVLSALTGGVMAGWVLLAVGAWRARLLGPGPAIALAATSALPLGVLKGTTPLSVVAVTGLAVALVPLGVRVVRDGPAPSTGTVARATAAVLAAVTVMALLGNAG